MKYLTYIFLLLTQCTYASIVDTVPNTMQLGQVSSSWEGMEFADPSAEITFLSPPEANVTGNANMSFPINLPSGRQGMQPQLTVSYDSETTGTWLGFGWDIGVSSISLDTRWGVPLFSDDTETEIYLLDGAQLGPVFHRAAEYPREAERTFVLRQTSEFQTIIRHGNTPKNYWWEVIDKDGISSYYGGSPETGSSAAHVLGGSKGIAEWMLMKKVDPNENNIYYNYQQTTGSSGKNIYPASIIYTGHENSQGNYSVHFSLRSGIRTDVTLSGRAGFLQSEEHILARIEVQFKAEQIRAYTFNYEEGVFGKTLLKSYQILDQNNEQFYEYTFEYYDDLTSDGSISAYESPLIWAVVKDNVDVGNITGNIDGFNGKPTLLGSALSTSVGGSVAVTVGLSTSPPNTKDLTAGPNGGYTTNDSKGLTALIDIDGDGLPDKLWKEEDGLYYRPNMLKGENPVPTFGTKTKISGITDFNVSNTQSWNVGAELNLPPLYAGYTHEEGTTKTSTYFVDFNGDELMDVVNEGTVFFNHLVDGLPHFNEEVSLTPSIIYKGEPLDPSIISIDPDELAEQENVNPLHDAVRLWRAPFDGNISINAPINLIEDTSAESQSYQTKDGVRTSIQVGSQEYWSQVIEEDDFSSYSPTGVNSVPVSEGDFVYFRVHSNYDGSYDEVNWDPEINYININDFNDANDLPYNNYKASEEFLLSEDKPVLITRDGIITISSKISKPVQTDNVVISITGSFDYSWTMGMNEIVDSTLVLEGIPVVAGDELYFTVSALSNVDWTKVQWEPVIEYSSFADGSSTTNSDGSPVVSICGTKKYDGFHFNENVGQVIDLNQADSITVSITLTGGIFPIGAYLVSLKLKGNIDTTYHYNGFGPFFETQAEVTGYDQLYVDIHYFEDENSGLFEVVSNTITIEQNTSQFNCGIWANVDYESGQYGHLYRGWGQFLYDGNDGRGTMPINLDALEIDEEETANDTTAVDENSGSTDLEGTGNNGELIIAMTSDLKLMAWRGSDEFAFVSPGKMGSSRKGKKYISVGLSSPINGQNFTSPELISKYYSNGGFGGLGVPGTPVSGSAGYTAATSYSVLDIADFNGDRYPDVISENKIVYTNFRGGLSSEELAYDWDIHESFSEAFSLGIGLNPGSTSPKNAGSSMGTGSNKSSSRIRQKGRSNAGKGRSSFESAAEAVGLSASVGSDEDHALHSFLDLNGDGLEDKVWENGDVALNLGYEFAPIENWGFTSIRSGDALDFGAGVGINISNGSILGGVSATTTSNGSQTGFIDLNGDALLDLVVSTEPMMVRFNTGRNFTQPVPWLDLVKFDNGFALGESANAGFTFSLIFFWFKLSFNFQGFIGQGMGTITDSFQDINGDGYPDYLFAFDGDNNLKASYSKIGRTNLLKKVNYPLGAELSLDYDVQGNNQNMPYSKWVLTETVMYDGLENDGSDFEHKTFTYENGYHDRHERQFYGFEKVKTLHHSGENTVKEVALTFEVNNFYTKGLLKNLELYDSEQNLHKSIEYSYELRDVETGILLPVSYTSKDDGMAFPLLSQQVNIYTEGGTDQFVQETYTFDYDSLGNLVRQVESDINNYYKESRWSYKTDFTSGIRNRIETEQIFGGSQLLKETSYSYDTRGNNVIIESSIDEITVAKTDLEYDIYGNVIGIRKPENYKGERLALNYIYESENNQYVISNGDSYGYIELHEYELFHGTRTKFTDRNGKVTSYGVDPKGRPTFMLNPVDSLAGHSYSVKYEYNPGATTPYALCKHKEPAGEVDIVTYAFADGLHRQVQTKFPALIIENGTEQIVSIVSGKNFLDSLGRVTAEFLQTTEPLSQVTSYNSDYSSVAPIKYFYDLNDRVTRIVNIDNGETTIKYDILIEDGLSKLRATQVNPNGLETELHYSSRQELLVEKKVMPSETSITRYRYDALSSTLTIVNPSGSDTNYSYDLLGRRISVDVPDAGETQLEYDKAGNLTKKITANIRDGLQENASIRYTYEQERLLTIDYPKNFQNKVQLNYGEAGAAHNRAGRIWLQQDGSGGREFFYDVFGNVTKEIRTIIVNRSEIYTYVTQYEHDAFQRITKIIYPDGEEVSYEYDSTSRLTAVEGVKENDTYSYINDIDYDEYLEIIKIGYGNTVQSTKKYDDKGRVTHQDHLVESSAFHNSVYAYDLEDNILNFSNMLSDDFLGRFSINHIYDERNRLIDSEGEWGDNQTSKTYSIFFDYNPTNTLSMKSQELKTENQVDPLTSRTYDYEYENDQYPSRPSSVAGRSFEYDLNGNLSLANSQTVFDFSQYIYDEENRMTGASINGETSLYTYDAFGRRAIKSQGTIQGIFINGAPAGLLEHTKAYRVEVNPYFTVFEHGYRKHIYVNNRRIMSKIGTGVFNTKLSEIPNITAGGIDYKARIQGFEQQILEYYASLGVPPGPPTLLAILGQPEFNSVGFDEIDGNNPYNALPPNWPLTNEPDTTGPPGSPIYYSQNGINNDNVQAGYNFTSGQITKELEQFYYHYDLLDNVNIVTGSDGQVRQHKMYLPSGELWLRKHKSIDSSSYAMGGYLLDDETGMYYMGEIYYDPVTNIELSIDKLEQTFGVNSINSRTEGNLYYDYADYQNDTDFDLQIVNSEKPDPFLSGASRVVDFVQDSDDDGFIIDFTKNFDAFTDEQSNPFTGKSAEEAKRRRRKETLSPESKNSQTFTEVFEAFEEANLQSPEGFNPSDKKAFKQLRKQAKKNKMRKQNLQKRKKNNKLKVKFRVT